MSPIRVRFAPSPTGHLHIGGARTALFNFLFARHEKGAFILRIEDTDKERSTPEATQGIIESMAWLGLKIDEGPSFQSQCLDRHREIAKNLLQKGLAYHCYCSAEELDEMRKQAEKKGEKPRYNGRCRELTQPPAGKEKTPPVIRFKTPKEGTVEVHDLIRGEITFRCEELDDLILLRSDESPTYNLSVVVDDMDTQITHVIRGDDHLNNTPRQILLFQALHATPPQYAHLSMILGPDKKKLSKRHNVPSVLIYREMGFLPEAVVNYLVRLGWSHGDQEVFDMKHLVDFFTLQNVGSSPCALNPEKLLWLNGHYLREMPASRVFEGVKEFLQQRGVERFPPLEQCHRLVELLRERTKTLVEMADQMMPYLVEEVVYHEEAVKQFLNAETKPLLVAVEQELDTLANWNPDSLKVALEALAQKREIKFVKIAQPMRVCLTGTAISPGIYDVLAFLGKERSLKRLHQGLNKIG